MLEKPLKVKHLLIVAGLGAVAWYLFVHNPNRTKVNTSISDMIKSEPGQVKNVTPTTPGATVTQIR